MKEEWTIEEVAQLKEEFDALGAQAWDHDTLSYGSAYRRAEESLTTQLGHYLYFSVPHLKGEGAITTIGTLRNLTGNALANAVARAKADKALTALEGDEHEQPSDTHS